MLLSGLVVAVVLGKDVSASLGCLKRLGDCGGFRLVVSRRCGLAEARNECFRFAGQSDLVVMVDDDLVFDDALLGWCRGVPVGCFGMARVGEHVSSRVLVIHKSDFDLVGGFDPAFRLIFEDGDFYRRALAVGLRFCVVPTGLYSHVEHEPRMLCGLGMMLRFNREYSRVFSVYPRWVYRCPLVFFKFPFRCGGLLVAKGLFVSGLRVVFTGVFLVAKFIGVEYYES